MLAPPLHDAARFGTLLTQVWMITGDKQETAINIAIACRLVHHPDTLLIINAAGSAE